MLKKKINKRKGLLCSINGNIYERKVYNIVKRCYINNKLFNTQLENELGGSSNKNDIECNFNLKKDIGIEIKKYNTPDWMQCSIRYDLSKNSWITSINKKKIKCFEIFNQLINKLNLYNGDIPPFFTRSITHEEWINIKKNTSKWNDIYIDISSDTISKLYNAKGCNYIQISNGFGLYHLGEDICNFNVPLFNIKQQLRIRTKIHKRKNSKGYCNISVTVACKPINIKNLIISDFSLDNINKIPHNIRYK